MLNLGDCVKHQATGNIGIVVGFGKRIVNNKCLPTTKVKIISPKSNRKTTVKDLDTQWLPCPQDFRVIHPTNSSKKRVFRPVAEKVRVKTA
ncbi:MAG: hypothetical protein AAGE96_11870 [Cyanobacteria bacterium P01_G01_bin.19]